MNNFYIETVTRLLDKGLMTRDMNILVVCGGRTDHEALSRSGFKRVTISNVDVRVQGDEFAPFSWSFQDAENLQYSDDTFDYCIAHNGLHHCYSPHRALLEMYRIASKGILIFEPHDSFFVRLGVKLGFGQEYEVAAVVGSDLKFGGVKNTVVPNYVYRWTEREIEKTVCSCVPIGRPRFHYFYAFRIPERRLRILKNTLKINIAYILLPFLRGFAFLFPRQCNNFAFAVEKPDLPSGLLPWLSLSEGKPTINLRWVASRYKTNSES